ncbi:MAG: hypothetical protein ACFB5Z_00640 [Elainellaceae cyanobacterium]
MASLHETKSPLPARVDRSTDVCAQPRDRSLYTDINVSKYTGHRQNGYL